ncbi:MAG: LysM peptidoglycan-binding domain-containing protein [Chloroflexi bacterium]|nr:LysM peptidoglycan-binding domain-containing protein [Chloroflexota bacterium]
MDTLNDIRDSLRENLLSVVALVFIVFILIAYAIFTITSIVPRWATRQGLATQLVTMQQTVRQTQQQQTSSNDALQAQLAGTQAQLDAAARQFLTETQAATILDNLYRYASETGVVISGLEAQEPPAETVIKTELYDIRIFALRVDGDVPQLLSFMGRLQETTWPGVALTQINLVENEAQATLTFTLSLYTSPYALGDAAATNIPFPAVTPVFPEPTPLPELIPISEVDVLIASLDTPWTAEDWPTVIQLLEQILTLAPDNSEMKTKLYAAYVNYGYRLLNEQKTSEAQPVFVQALTIFPDGAEALAGLQSATNPAAAAITPTIHIVARGDTLFLIARRYGIPLAALRSANGLTSDTIYPGQTLLIPQ